MNLASPRLCPKLSSTPAELSAIFQRIGQHVRDVVIRASEPSSRTDAAVAAALVEMPNVRTLTVIYDPLDTRRHTPLLGALRLFHQLEHITLAEPPRCDWAPGWPIRLGYQEPATQRGEIEAVEMDSGTESDSESGSERGPDTDTEAPTGPTRQPGATRNLHSFRNLFLMTILQHHAPRLLSVRLQGSVPLSEHSYRQLRDTASNLMLLQLIGAFESGSAGLVAAFMEETAWACAGRLRDLSISGGSLNAVSEARVMRQFKLGVFGDSLDEPSVTLGKARPKGLHV